MNNLADLLSDLGETAEAETLYRATLEGRRAGALLPVT